MSMKALWRAEAKSNRAPNARNGGFRVGAVADRFAGDRMAQRAEDHIATHAHRHDHGVVQMRGEQPALHAVRQAGQFRDALQQVGLAQRIGFGARLRDGRFPVADLDDGIGKDNDLPWPRLPTDLRTFKRITSAFHTPSTCNAPG